MYLEMHAVGQRTLSKLQGQVKLVVFVTLIFFICDDPYRVKANFVPTVRLLMMMICSTPAAGPSRDTCCSIANVLLWTAEKDVTEAETLLPF